MGCSSSKESLALPSSNSNNNRNLAWSDDSPLLVETEQKPASASSRKSRKASPKIIRIKSAESSASTEVEDITPNKNAMTILKKQNSQNSLESLADDDVDGGSVNRGVSSATSKVSAYTYDSGLEVDCPGMITENSDPTELEKIETQNRPSTPDLSLVGTKLDSRKRSGGKTKPAQSTAAILGELQSQGLLTAAPAKAQSGMSFEVMIAPEFGVLKRPPPRLAKLKKRKKKQSELTKEEVEEKMKAAEARRKRKEAKMIARLNTSAKERQVQAALDTFVESQRTQTKSKVTKDLDAATQRREEHFRNLKKKLEEKKKHAEKVRQAKQERSGQTPAPPAEEADGSAGNVTEDTSLV